HVVKQAASIRPIWLSVLGLAWFWVVGTTLLTELPSFVRDVLHGSGDVMTLLMTIFAVGVGLGSIVCARLLKGEVSPRHVPFAALGVSLFCWDFAFSSTAAGQLADINAVLSSVQGWRMLIDLLLLSACGGAFSVPLYAIVQHYSPAQSRARIIAGNNVVNSVFMVAASGAAFAFAWLGVLPPRVLDHAAAAAGGDALAVPVLFRHLPRCHRDRPRQLPRRRRPRRHCFEPHLLRRCLSDCLLSAGQSYLCRAFAHSRALVGASVSCRGRHLQGRRAVGLFGQAHGRSGQGPRPQADDLSRRAAHQHRGADEGLR